MRKQSRPSALLQEMGSPGVTFIFSVYSVAILIYLFLKSASPWTY